MKPSSNALTFNDVSAEARTLQANFSARESVDLGPEPEGVRRLQVAMRARFENAGSRRVLRLAAGDPDYADLSLPDQMWLAMHSRVEHGKNPFYFSELAGYLELETWTPREALLILAGVDPGAALVDWNYENFLGATIDKPVIRRATWFADTGDHYDYPLVADFDHSPPELRLSLRQARAMGDTHQVARLEAELAQVERWANDPTTKYVQNMLSLRSELLYQLARIWFSAHHDANARQSPAFFVRWAESRGFEIEWTEWARHEGHLEIELPVTAPPFFDADAEDYPELLHIAVRAWGHARQTSGGTPKKRIIDFVSDRYPLVSEGARDAIALVANWQKAGGRPKTGG